MAVVETTSDHEITRLLEAVQRDEPGANDRLMSAVYEELRQLAKVRLAAEGNNITLQPTALVHEAWLRLGGDRQTAWENRAHFFSAAAEAMRRILIDRARKRNRQRSGGGIRPVSLSAIAEPSAESESAHVIAVDEALQKLAQKDAAYAELVKLRYFLGLSLQQTATALGISERTAKRRWAFSRAWLERELRQVAVASERAP